MTLRTPFRSLLAGLPRAAILAVALMAAGACTSQKDIDALPGLVDVRPTGPDGKKCFEFCAQAKVNCDHMCPNSMGICQKDCTNDSKHCLVDCPEMLRPEPPKEK